MMMMMTMKNNAEKDTSGCGKWTIKNATIVYLKASQFLIF